MERSKRLYPTGGEQACSVRRKGQPHRERSPAKGDAPRGLLRDAAYAASWRDLPSECGEWRMIYDRHNRGNVRWLWNKALVRRNRRRGLGSMGRSSTVRRWSLAYHGGGQRASCARVSQRGNRNDAKAAPELAEEVHDCHVPGGSRIWQWQTSAASGTER